jgi:hypothetical protein
MNDDHVLVIIKTWCTLLTNYQQGTIYRYHESRIFLEYIIY